MPAPSQTSGRIVCICSILKPPRLFTASWGASSFSDLSIEQVEYTSLPPFFRRGRAFFKILICSALQFEMSFGSILYRASGRLRKTPVLEHGASRRIASKEVGRDDFSSLSCKFSLAMSQSMQAVFKKSIFDRFCFSFSRRGEFKSTLASRVSDKKPSGFFCLTRSEIIRLFPPGAAHKSKMFSDFCGFKRVGANFVAGSWI